MVNSTNKKHARLGRVLRPRWMPAVQSLIEEVAALKVTLEESRSDWVNLREALDLHAKMIAELDQRLTAVHGSDALHAQMIAELDQRLTAVHGSDAIHAQMIAELDQRLTRTNSQVEVIDSEMVARPYTADAGESQGAVVLSFGSGLSPSEGYASFEDCFRGDEPFITGRLADYVPMVEGLGAVVDIGCGRGEFLSLLKVAGVEARGVDLDPEMLARAEQRGLRVTRGDGIAYLEGLEGASLGAVVSFQVVEHMPVDQLRALMSEAYRVLKPGGLFIAETVNPHSPAALKTFWLDLTHVRPLYPESLLHVAHELGYSSGSVYFPGGGDDQELNLRQCGEYALLATK